MNALRHPARALLSLQVCLLLVGIAAVPWVLWHQGYRMYVVHTGSMSPTYRPGDLVVDRPAHDLRPGQVITFRQGQQGSLVTHRIADLATAQGQAGIHTVIHTKGDANASQDSWDIRPERVQGVVSGSVPHLGYVVVFFKQRQGIASAITAGLALVLLYQLFFPPASRPIEALT